MEPDTLRELPKPLQVIRADVERAAGAKIRWCEVNDLPGLACADWISGNPRIRYRQFTHESAAHEMLHLLLDLGGYPKLRTTDFSRVTIQVVTVLHNLLQHEVIFPRLRELGFSPTESECNAVSNQIVKLRESPSGARLDSVRVALVAVVVVRARRSCSDRQYSKLIGTLFEERHVPTAVRSAADAVEQVLALTSTSTVDQYKTTALACIEALGLSENIEFADPCCED